MKIATIFVLIAAIISTCFGHSVMMEPQGMSSQECRVGGSPDGKCPGPCDISKYTGESAANPWTRYFPPSNPVPRDYKRGETITVKYTRNNHGPGGFIRLTLVPLADMMNKEVHARNAFHYSCWGARLRLATTDAERAFDKYGFSLVSDDGKDHNQTPGYYTSEVTIPPVVPDGQYILGWVWYGGTSGQVTTNLNQAPHWYAFFTDYWSCAFVTVKGGAPLASSYTPVFVNDYIFDKTKPEAEGWENGCMAQNDAPGVCKGEPCRGPDGIYRKPRPFKDGPPRALTPADFGGDNAAATSTEESNGSTDPAPTPKAETTTETTTETAPSPSPSPAAATTTEESSNTPSSDEETSTAKSGEISWKGRASCVCLIYDDKCHAETAKWTDGCKANTAGADQSSTCKKSCCDMCKTENSYYCTLMRTSC